MNISTPEWDPVLSEFYSDSLSVYRLADIFWRRLTTGRYDLDYQTPDEVVEDADLERLWLYANLNTCL
jgi:hypothetical protein